MISRKPGYRISLVSPHTLELALLVPGRAVRPVYFRANASAPSSRAKSPLSASLCNTRVSKPMPYESHTSRAGRKRKPNTASTSAFADILSNVFCVILHASNLAANPSGFSHSAVAGTTG